MQPEPTSTQDEETSMSRKADTTRLPALELRCPGLHLTIQRVPTWFLWLITTVGGAGAAWWVHQ